MRALYPVVLLSPLVAGGAEAMEPVKLPCEAPCTSITVEALNRTDTGGVVVLRGNRTQVGDAVASHLRSTLKLNELAVTFKPGQGLAFELEASGPLKIRSSGVLEIVPEAKPGRSLASAGIEVVIKSDLPARWVVPLPADWLNIPWFGTVRITSATGSVTNDEVVLKLELAGERIVVPTDARPAQSECQRVILSHATDMFDTVFRTDLDALTTVLEEEKERLPAAMVSLLVLDDLRKKLKGIGLQSPSVTVYAFHVATTDKQLLGFRFHEPPPAHIGLFLDQRLGKVFELKGCWFALYSRHAGLAADAFERLGGAPSVPIADAARRFEGEAHWAVQTMNRGSRERLQGLLGVPEAQGPEVSQLVGLQAYARQAKDPKVDAVEAHFSFEYPSAAIARDVLPKVKAHAYFVRAKARLRDEVIELDISDVPYRHVVAFLRAF